MKESKAGLQKLVDLVEALEKANLFLNGSEARKLNAKLKLAFEEAKKQVAAIKNK